MKRVNNIYNDITDIDVIMDMYDKVIHKNMKNKRKLEYFDNYYCENLKAIKEELMTKQYEPKKYNIFLIREPKYRIIMGQNVPDKIVNHLVAKYFLVPYFEKDFITTNVATRKGMGTHYGLKLFKQYYNNMKINHNKFYVLKFDIKKYFYSLDHNIIKELIRRKIKDRDVINLIDKIIDSTDKEYVNIKINKLKENRMKKIQDSNTLKQIQEIPTYEQGKGFPIGNMTSQFFGIMYLNELDHYIKEVLGIKYYERYMDDGILIHHDKDYLKYCFKKIEELIQDKYKIQLNKNKSKIYENKEEIEFLGFRFITKNNRIIVKVRNGTKKRFKRKMKKIDFLYTNNLIDYAKVQNIKASYLGHLKHGDCKQLVNRHLGIYL